jgi:tetratricopeptide (TPR) repeat protein
MKKSHLAVLALAALLAVPAALLAQPAPAPRPAIPAAPPSGAGPLAGTAVVPDLAERLAKWKVVEMPFDDRLLTPRERELVDKLVEASRALEDIYWRQGDPADIPLYNALQRSTSATSATSERDRAVARMLWIHGSRYDLVDENRPFLGSAPPPPGRALYPVGLTRKEIEDYVAAHPEAKAALLNEHTVVVRSGKGLSATPYHVAYKPFLDRAASALREAAKLSDDPGFAKFLTLRAAALLSDDYYASDIAWLDLQNPKFDIIFAPYETYLDDLLGIKTSYGAAVMVRNETESAKLSVFQKYIPDIQDALPLDPKDRPSKKGHVAPMEVMDTPFRAGDLRHGYQAVADNLPNDPRVHQKKGSKQIFFKNFMDARVNEVILPLAKRVMREDQAKLASADGYLALVMMHEICHGLGPAFARMSGKEVDIRQAIGPIYSGLEEAKADVTGMFGLAWLVGKNALPKERLPEYYASYLAGIFRTVRFGIGEAHGKAEMMEFNYLAEQGAIARDPAAGTYSIDLQKIPGALAALTKELLTIEATGDRARAESWFTKYDVLPATLKADLEKGKDLPVDIDPHGSFKEGVE